MAMEVRFLERLRKKARNGVRDWPIATIAFYGSTLSRATVASNSPGRILAGAKPADLPVAQSTKSSSSYQPANRQGAWHRDAAGPPCHRRRGHRIDGWACRFTEPPASKDCALRNYTSVPAALHNLCPRNTEWLKPKLLSHIRRFTGLLCHGNHQDYPSIRILLHTA
jgi:hypothetical protein